MKYWALIVVAVFLTLSVISRYGMETFYPPIFDIGSAIQHSGHYTVDPRASIFLPYFTPLLAKVSVDTYDIPFYHLLFGILGKFLIVVGLFWVTWNIARSVLACFLAAILLFGLTDFSIFYVDMPLGIMSHEIRSPAYFSFRQIGTVFIIVSLGFLLRGQYLGSSLLLALGFYAHPLNIVAFFLSFSMAFVVSFFIKKNKFAVIGSMLKLTVPFLILISPYFLTGSNIFKDVEPISSSQWWDFLLKNSPNDASILHYRKAFIKEFFLTIMAGVLFVLVRSERPLTGRSVVAVIRDERDFVLPLLFAPWVVSFFAAVWEGVLIYRLPDFLNDIFIPLELRRCPTVATFVYIPVFAAFSSRLILIGTQKSLEKLIQRKGDSGSDPAVEGRVRSSLDLVLGVSLSFLIFVFFFAPEPTRLIGIKDYWDFKHRRDEYFMMKRVGHIYPRRDSISSREKVIPHAALLDVCTFIRNHTIASAAFFNPTYIPFFLAYCERQGFLGEAEDGNLALFNRKFATIYLKRFADIHKGLTYRDLPGIVIDGGPAYSILRERYLSLRETDVDRLRTLYPGYRYFLTEVGHRLAYRIMYRNDYFLVYDLEQGQTAQ